MSAEEDKAAIARASEDFNGRWTPQAAKDYNNSGDKKRTGFEKLAKHVSGKKLWEEALDHRLSGPIGAIGASIITATLMSGDPASQGPTELDMARQHLHQAAVEIAQLKSRPPTSNFIANETLHLTHDPDKGRQTAFIPAEVLLKKSSFSLPGQNRLSFEQGLETLGDLAKEPALGSVIVIDSNTKWASTVGAQVDERLLQSPSLRTEFVKKIDVMESDIPQHSRGGAQTLNYYFTYNANAANAADKVQLYRDPGAPGGNDVKLIPEI